MTVSASLMAPDEFGRRFDQARRELEAASAQVVPRMVEAPVVERAEILHSLYRESHEPRLEQGAGARGWFVFNIKRTIRKATRWYVEPRWIADREYDAELARFATDVALQIEALERRVGQLEEWNGQLLRRAHLADRTVRTEQVG